MNEAIITFKIRIPKAADKQMIFNSLCNQIEQIQQITIEYLFPSTITLVSNSTIVPYSNEFNVFDVQCLVTREYLGMSIRKEISQLLNMEYIEAV